MKEHTTHLTPEQVHQLNEKHGWFTYGDANSDVSKAFAQDAIAMHERMRAAAPQLLAALQQIIAANDAMELTDKHMEVARAAIAATGA